VLLAALERDLQHLLLPQQQLLPLLLMQAPSLLSLL
jgi:hypothetical protein